MIKCFILLAALVYASLVPIFHGEDPEKVEVPIIKWRAVLSDGALLPMWILVEPGFQVLRGSRHSNTVR